MKTPIVTGLVLALSLAATPAKPVPQAPMASDLAKEKHHDHANQ